jgi:DNA-directed RNA polymerase sigma subunit (sigma70/sigma32)
MKLARQAGVTLQAIADALGITRERVRQITRHRGPRLA